MALPAVFLHISILSQALAAGAERLQQPITGIETAGSRIRVFSANEVLEAETSLSHTVGPNFMPLAGGTSVELGATAVRRRGWRPWLPRRPTSAEDRMTRARLLGGAVRELAQDRDRWPIRRLRYRPPHIESVDEAGRRTVLQEDAVEPARL
jgi:hypothetical protein